jgi:putative membrane protein (TIGR04086 family)
MTKLKTWPIVVGILIDTLGSIGVGVLYFVGIFGLQIARGAPASDEPFGTPHLIVTEIVGLFLTTVGGFAAARMARTRHIQHGIAVGFGALLVWLLVDWVSPSDTLPVWYETASLIGVVPVGALGGYVAKRAYMPLQPTSDGPPRTGSGIP